jgi:hypothetical protein
MAGGLGRQPQSRKDGLIFDAERRRSSTGDAHTHVHLEGSWQLAPRSHMGHEGGGARTPRPVRQGRPKKRKGEGGGARTRRNLKSLHAGGCAVRLDSSSRRPAAAAAFSLGVVVGSPRRRVRALAFGTLPLPRPRPPFVLPQCVLRPRASAMARLVVRGVGAVAGFLGGEIPLASALSAACDLGPRGRALCTPTRPHHGSDATDSGPQALKWDQRGAVRACAVGPMHRSVVRWLTR